MTRRDYPDSMTPQARWELEQLDLRERCTNCSGLAPWGYRTCVECRSTVAIKRDAGMYGGRGRWKRKSGGGAL